MECVVYALYSSTVFKMCKSKFYLLKDNSSPKVRIGPLNQGMNLIGSDSSMCVQIHSELCSSTHCSININNNFIYVKDMNSLNGTFINEVKIVKNVTTVIQNGCHIRIGDPFQRKLQRYWISKQIR